MLDGGEPGGRWSPRTGEDGGRLKKTRPLTWVVTNNDGTLWTKEGSFDAVPKTLKNRAL